MADPLLGDYPVKALYQALAVAAMCLQEEAETRPLISDVVTALEFLTGNKVPEMDTGASEKSGDSNEEDGGNNGEVEGEEVKDG